jgi:hypothetical protein
MGGRGARSGIDTKGKRYGTEYRTVHQIDDIKFVVQNEQKPVKTPMETMTKNRIYVTLGKDGEPKSITSYDRNGKRERQIDLTHYHTVNGTKTKPHTHMGYEHEENGTRKPSVKEKKTIDKVMKAWENYKQGK